MKRYLILILYSLFLTINMNALDEKELSFIGFGTTKIISLGDSIEKVYDVYGTPTEKKFIKKSGDEPAYFYLIYKGLVIGYYEGVDKVELIRITNSKYVTTRGVAVGDSYNTVVEKYGDFDYSQPGLILYRTEIQTKSPWDEYKAIFFCFDKYNYVIEIEIS